MTQVIVKSTLLLGALGMMSMGCGDGKSDTGDTTASTGTGTGGTTGATTTTTEPMPSTGFARAVHLILDVPIIDIYLFDEVVPLIPDFPQYGNSDAYADYAPFPPLAYESTAKDNADDSILTTLNVTVAVDDYFSLLFHGGLGAGMANPAWAPMATVVTDDVSDAPAGEHRLTVFHMAPTVGDLNLWSGTASATGLSYGAWVTLTVAPGTTVLGVNEMPGSTAPRQDYELTLVDGGWSYLYILPSDVQPGGAGTALHHVRSEVNLPVIPTPTSVSTSTSTMP